MVLRGPGRGCDRLAEPGFGWPALDSSTRRGWWPATGWSSGCDDGRVSEPKTVASSVEEVVPGIRRWSIHDERIDFLGAAYAVGTGDGVVMIDPLPLEDEPLAELGRVEAIVLTCGSHQRCAWRYRRELGVEVYAPALAKEIDEEPDVRYGEGDTLPAGLDPVFTPGAGTTQHTLLLGDPKVAFVPDMLVEAPDGRVAMLASRWMYDPDEARRSVEKLLDLDFDVLCLAHGGAVTEDAKEAVRSALAGPAYG
jgi:Metallo-beta-lactamase superfamily